MADDLLGAISERIEHAEQMIGREAGEIDDLSDYYRNRQGFPWIDDRRIANDYRRMVEKSRSNFMRIVVDSVAERLEVNGFRLSPAESQAADDDAWMIWQTSGMDALSKKGFNAALVGRRCYWSIAEGDNGTPRIALEDPRNTWVEFSQNTASEREWAARVWKRGDVEHARYWDDERTVRLERGQRGWEVVDESVYSGLGVVPVVPMVNRASLWTPYGESEIDDVTETQDRINETLFYRMLAGYFVAHPQKWVTGLVPDYDEDGNPIEPFDVGIDRILAVASEQAKFGSFPQADLRPYIEAVEQDVLHIAVQTRTPRHYLIEQGQAPSGDAMKSAETGLVAKVRDKQVEYGEALEETMRIARRMQSGADTPPDSEIMWADPEYRTEGELVDALVKMGSLGVPAEFLWERWGMTPQEVARVKRMAVTERVLAGLREEPDPGLEDDDADDAGG